jgi:RNA polymerase sigma-70 factor, ECF subfamily
MTDEELIQRYYEGNREALSMIFERHKDGVFHFAYRMVNNRADAEDAVSDAFMRICDLKHRFETKAAFKTWFYTIVRNACIDKIRGKRKWTSMWFTKPGCDEVQEMEFVSQDENVSQTLEGKEAAQYVKEAIARLPMEQREAIVLREYNDLSYDEIAQILGCTLANVKILIYRARTQLKNDLPAFMIDPSSDQGKGHQEGN